MIHFCLYMVFPFGEEDPFFSRLSDGFETDTETLTWACARAHGLVERVSAPYW